MDRKRIRCLQIVSQHVRIYLQQFPSYSNRKCKKTPFPRTAAHIFVSPGDAPATITQYVVWMERQFNACQTTRSMCLSIFNSFRVMRCLRQCVSPKIAIFTTFLFPLGTPLQGGNHAACCMDGKRIRCLQIVSQHVPIYLQQFPRYTMSMRKSKNRYFYHIFVSPGDAPGAITLNVVWMEREFDAYKLSRCMCPIGIFISLSSLHSQECAALSF